MLVVGQTSKGGHAADQRYIPTRRPPDLSAAVNIVYPGVGAEVDINTAKMFLPTK
jgi:hypothetical protein